MNNLIRLLSNLIYFSFLTKKRYQKEHPDETVVLCDASKAVKLPVDKEPEYGREWVTSRRCSFLLSNKAIKAGNWTILLQDIAKTELIKFNYMYGKGMVLKVSTLNNENYQFGMQYNKAVEVQDFLELSEVREQRLKKSTLSMLLRVLAVGYILYVILDHFIL